MRSHEVLKKVIEKTGVKKVAEELKISRPLLYKWCQEPPSEENLDASGAANPLDRILSLYHQTQDDAPIRWLCENTGGFYVKNPQEIASESETAFLKKTQQILQDFSALLQKLSESHSDDQHIDSNEAETIRENWELLKSNAEEFVMGCEKGVFNRELDQKT